MDLQTAYRTLYSGALIVLAVLLAVMLYRCVKVPGATDRLLCINMIGTMVTATIVILALLMGESWLLDVALIYTMISLLSVLILARVYIPAQPSRKRFLEEDHPKQAKPSGAATKKLTRRARRKA